MALSFVKLQGLGNDFVVIDRRTASSPLAPAEAVRLCDRRLGIGADGVLSVLEGAGGRLRMHVTNADGSVAEMCGNGLRCLVRWAADRGLLSPGGGGIETDAGVRETEVLEDGRIRVDMGAPELFPARIPLEAEGDRFVDQPLRVDGAALRITAVSMGNPHAVWFVEGAADLRRLATRLGPAIERHERFPKHTNAAFARLTGPRSIDLVVWERGSGLTQACGTGACATVVAAVLGERVPAGEEISVRLPGGELSVRVEPALSRVWMTGPVVEVFRGAVD